jgi:hypothetical protein
VFEKSVVSIIILVVLRRRICEFDLREKTVTKHVEERERIIP